MVWLDYENKKIIFSYEKKNIRIEKRFEDFLKVKRYRHLLITITSKDHEKYKFYLENIGMSAWSIRSEIWGELNEILKYSLKKNPNS